MTDKKDRNTMALLAAATAPNAPRAFVKLWTRIFPAFLFCNATDEVQCDSRRFADLPLEGEILILPDNVLWKFSSFRFVYI